MCKRKNAAKIHACKCIVKIYQGTLIQEVLSNSTMQCWFCWFVSAWIALNTLLGFFRLSFMLSHRRIADSPVIPKHPAKQSTCCWKKTTKNTYEFFFQSIPNACSFFWILPSSLKDKRGTSVLRICIPQRLRRKKTCQEGSGTTPLPWVSTSWHVTSWVSYWMGLFWGHDGISMVIQQGHLAALWVSDVYTVDILPEKKKMAKCRSPHVRS